MNESSYTRQVILSMSLGMGIVLAARGLEYVNESNGRRIANPLPNLGGVESFLAWGVILVFLVALADFDSTGALGASFGWLIFFAVMYAYGVGAFENLRLMMNGASAPSSTAKTIPARKVGPR